MSTIILTSAIAVLVYMTSVFIAAQLKKDNSIVDIAWGPGFLVIALLQLINKDNLDLKDFILAGMIFIWALRLSIHIYLRSKGKGEDFRYAQWRKDWGSKAVVNAFVRVFMLQGVIMLIVALPIMIIFYNSSNSFSAFNFIGIGVFIFGLFFESVGDFQLYNFKKNPNNKRKIIKSGLWKVTRHPNYFGESVLWWGIGIYTIGMDLFYLALIGPLALNLLLLFVSGVPLLEKKYEGNPEWEDYKKVTPAFIPYFGKKG